MGLDEWHEVRLLRRLQEGSLALDFSPAVTGRSPGATRGLNIRTPLYLGGVPSPLTLAGRVGVTSGLRGCFASLLVSGREVHLVEEAVASAGVTECSETGCKGEARCEEEEDEFYSDLLEETMGDFDEDLYLERINRRP